MRPDPYKQERSRKYAAKHRGTFNPSSSGKGRGRGRRDGDTSTISLSKLEDASSITTNATINPVMSPKETENEDKIGNTPFKLLIIETLAKNFV